jgi:hypothetical protein
MRLISTAFSAEPASTGNGVLPIDGSHFRHTQLQLIFRGLGIQRLPVRRRRHLFRIDEVVDNRNFIAHGEERPEDVGRRYTRQEISTIIRQMKSVCLLIPSVITAHCDDAENLCRA